MSDYFVLAALVMAINMLPAFAPPTWSVLVLYRLNSHLAPIPLVIIGALSAGLGRYLLAKYTGYFRRFIPKKQLGNLQAAGYLLQKNRKSALAGIALFTLSPLPSAQLFEAAGLIGKRLEQFTIAFFAGRLVSYSLYVAGASVLKSKNVGEIFSNSLKSPWGIAIQLLGLVAIYGITKIDWRRFTQIEKNPTEVKD